MGGHHSRSAATIFIRAALIEGSAPPIIPITMANMMEFRIIERLSRNRKVSSEKVVQFIVEIVNLFINDAAARPIAAPSRLKNKDSPRKASMINTLRNPSALRVPISDVRAATAANMVIIDPVIAPRLKINVRLIPSIRINLAISSD